MALSPNGSATLMKIDEFDHVITARAASTTTQQVANGVMVFAVTARVVDAITGTRTSWELGAAGTEHRFGSGLGRAQGSYARGMLSQR